MTVTAPAGQDHSTPNPAAFDAARGICRQHAKSFYFASKFLPRPKRDAAYAVYAFCRLLDDATDEAESADVSAKQIDRFLAILDNAYQNAFIAGGGFPGLPPKTGASAVVPHKSGPLSRYPGGGLGWGRFIGLQTTSPNPIAPHPSPPPEYRERENAKQNLALLAFAITVREYDIPKSCFIDIADGCRMDLTISRYQTWDDLRQYCYRVAGVVGVIMSRIFGLDDSSAEKQAVLMGEAMQLTNILRDIGEDAGRGRIYLPLEDLDRFGYSQSDLLAGVVNEPFRQLMKFEIDRARDLYRDGAQGLRYLVDDGSRFTATAMGVIYAGILKAIERQNYDVYNRRARLTLSQKLLRLPIARRLSRGQMIDAF